MHDVGALASGMSALTAFMTGLFVATASSQVCELGQRFPQITAIESLARTERAAVEDIDADGDTDIVFYTEAAISGGTVGDIAMLRNNGDDTFAAAEVLASVEEPRGEPVALDLNGDGMVDIALATGDNSPSTLVDHAVAILLNTGGGSFSPLSEVDVERDLFWLIGGDIDADGDNDLLVGTFSNGIAVLLNDGAGSFARGVSLPLNASDGTLADVDGDSDLDLLAVSSGSDTVSVFRNLGGGSFAAAATFATGDAPRAIEAADLDSDGFADAVIANAGQLSDDVSDTVTVHFGTGTGALLPPVAVAVGDFPLSVDLGDVDGDGDLDIAAGSNIDDVFGVIINNADRTFKPAALYGNSAFRRADQVMFARLSGTASLDLLVLDGGDAQFNLARNDGNGVFGTDRRSTVAASPRSLAAVDLNADGLLDLVSGHVTNGVCISRNGGVGGFASLGCISLPGFILDLAIGDFDGDGDDDIAAPQYGSGTIYMLTNNGEAPAGADTLST